MELEERLEVLKTIRNVAAVAGLKGEIDPDGQHFSMEFATAKEGRTQRVFVKPVGKTLEGQTVVAVFSPALVVKKGMFAGMSKDQAIELLRMNETLNFARFGIWESDEQSMVVASSDLLLEAMDAEELRTHASYVALAADGYEMKFGGDQF